MIPLLGLGWVNDACLLGMAAITFLYGVFGDMKNSGRWRLKKKVSMYFWVLLYLYALALVVKEGLHMGPLFQCILPPLFLFCFFLAGNFCGIRLKRLKRKTTAA